MFLHTNFMFSFITGTYFMAMITISCLSISVTVTVLSIFHTRSNRPVPNKLKRFTTFFLSCFLPSESFHQVPGSSKCAMRHGNSLQMEAIMDLGTAPPTTSTASVLDSESVLHEDAIQNTVAFEKQDIPSVRERVLDDWKEIALVFDKVFGYLLLFATCIVLGYVMIEFLIIHTILSEPAHNEHE